MIPALKPIDNVMIAYQELLDTNDIEERTGRIALSSLQHIQSDKATITELQKFIDRIDRHTQKQPHLSVIADALKRALKPLSLYSSTPGTHSYYPSLNIGSISSLPSSVVSLYYDLFVDGKGPWKQIFDLMFTSLHHIPSLNLNIKDEEETQELEAKTMALVRVINNTREESYIRYPVFIDLLREIANLPATYAHTDHPCVRYIRRVCYSHYVDLKIYPFCEQLIYTMLNEGRKQLGQYNPDVDSFQLPLEDQFRFIHAAPQKLKAPLATVYWNWLRGAVNFNFDSHRGTNIPWALFDFSVKQKDSSEKKVRVLRMGTPTYQRTTFAEMTWNGKANIDPEFRLFIEGLIALNQNILFISLQDDIERSFGTENTRNDAQKMLCAQYPKRFFYSIFAHDSPFYHQTGDYADKGDANAFKAAFFEQLISNKTGFYFPEDWLADSTFKDMLLAIIADLHYILFNDKPELNQKERCSFIQICYIFLALKLLIKTGADKLVFCCKDSIDRAGIENALLHYVLLICYDQEMSEEQLKAMMVYIHAATVIVKQQEMNHRHERLLWALEILQDPRVRSRIKLRSERWYGVTGPGLALAK